MFLRCCHSEGIWATFAVGNKSIAAAANRQAFIDTIGFLRNDTRILKKLKYSLIRSFIHSLIEFHAKNRNHQPRPSK